MVKDDRSVLFVHVPKTGGSTIERLFKHSGWITHFLELQRDRPRFFPLRRCSPQHYHAALLTELLQLSKFDVRFMLVRDPIARFRSEFAMRNNLLERADEPTVEAWAERMFGLYEQDPYTYDNHLRPQAEFLTPDTEVYRLEDGIKRAVRDLNKRFDMRIDREPGHRLKSENRGLPSSAVPISPALRKRLQDFYAADYEAFGYRG